MIYSQLQVQDILVAASSTQLQHDFLVLREVT